MAFDILLAPEAIADLRRLDARRRGEVRDALEIHLRHEPQKASRSRIKRLTGLARPGYRLRVGDIRIFYDVVGSEVQVLAIVEKSRASAWLAALGAIDEEGSSV